MRKNSIKSTRINAEVAKELSLILHDEMKDPRIHVMTSIVAVEVTTDLKFAKVFVSVLGNEEEKNNTMEGLESASSFIRKVLASRLNLRNTPQLTFILDTSIEYGAKMSKKIEELNGG
ncbi:MAG: 30S ribosome-binding factor RbfA [Lachnoclostridium sp.]|jgi:ribosome-binding factor A|nr:30S ribosome-binding factor RbfA [Lachnoclostridium sp.]